MGITAKLLDSLNFFVENQDVATSIFRVSGATGSYASSDFINTMHKGGKFFFAITTVHATATINIGMQSKDPVSGLYVTGVTASFEIDAAQSNVVFALHMYPGAGVLTSSVEYNSNEALSRTMRVIASIAVAATATATAIVFTTGVSKIL